MIKTYNAFINDCDCCSHVNTNRHNVETRLSIVDGEIASASCSWCGRNVEVPREKLFEGTRLVIGIFGSDYDAKETYLFEGNEYYGYPMGVKVLDGK